ncbi:MAG: hypothetical protein M1482_16810 [Chloroflexi bacterium]|nr:hypothetical protein [Chloroflexota bacterium]
MNKNLFALVVAGLVVAIAASGCGSVSPTPPPTQPPIQITVIVTATPPPATDTPAAPSITPLPTINPEATVVVDTPTKVAVALNTPKPAATKKPTVPAATETPTAAPLTLPAPKLVRPNFNPDLNQKDERHSPSDALVFEWESISPLATGVCYMVRVDFVPTNSAGGTGDQFLQCDPNETQKAQAQTVRFTLYQPGHTGPNYSGLLPNPSTDLWVKWSVTVVTDVGPTAEGGAVDPTTGTRHQIVPQSPKSDTFQFLLKGG